MYENQTYEAILKKMLDSCPSTLDKSEGSFLYDAISPMAIELALAYAELDRVLNMGFAHTSSGQYLDYRAEEHGLKRKRAAAAIGTISLTGTAGSIIKADSIVATSAGVQFKTTEDVIIGSEGTIDVSVEAVEAGTSGNVPMNIINTVPFYIPGLASVNNTTPTSGGTDEEKDDALRRRLMEKVSQSAISGNKREYKEWAISTDGVGKANVIPLWNGNGTVKVIIVDSNMQPASDNIVKAVQTAIEDQKPIGANVSVVSATSLPINVSAKLSLSSGYTVAGIQSKVEDAIDSYLKSIVFDQSYVSYGKVGSIILDIPGVTDYSNLTINGGTANVSIDAEQVSVKGTVTLS